YQEAGNRRDFSRSRMIEGHLRFQPSRPWLKSAAAHLECQPWHKMVTAPRSNRLPQIFSDGSRYQTFVKALKLRSCKEAKKQRSKEAKKQRSKEAKKQRSKEAKKQRSKEAKKQRSKEAKKQRRSTGAERRLAGLDRGSRSADRRRPFPRCIEQAQSERRDQDVHVEDDTGIARREVAVLRHLADMAGGGAEREQAGADNRGEAQIVAAKGGEEADDGKAQAGRRHFELERAIGPSDERGGQPAEERVHDEVVEVAHADRPEHVPGQQSIDDERGGFALWTSSDRDGREDETDHQEGQ